MVAKGAHDFAYIYLCPPAWLFLTSVSYETLTVMNLLWDVLSDVLVTLSGVCLFREGISHTKMIGVGLSLVSIFLLTWVLGKREVRCAANPKLLFTYANRMRRSLDDFPGFRVGSGPPASAFSPFASEVTPKRTHDVVKMVNDDAAAMRNVLGSSGVPKPAQAQAPKVENVLDSSQRPLSSHIGSHGANVLGATKPDAPTEPLALFPQVPTQPIVETEPLVPMIQPRAKDGQRLLYKHPNLPRVGVKGVYWMLVGQSDRSEAAWLLQFDGAANPNPGPASSGAVLWSPPDVGGKRRPVFEMGKFLGKATNNIAEVQGLLLGLKMAAVRGARELLIEGDSELIIFQQTGRYKVSDRNLKVWWSEIQAAMMDETVFDWIAIRQVPREQNERADGITKEVLGRREGFQRAY